MEDQLKREQKIRYREESSHIRVHVRLKQSPEKEGATYNIFSNGTQLHVPNTDGRLELDKWYRFDHIYSPISSNKEVYKLSAYDLVESALNGLNTAVFAYGQTGSGKTRTLMSKDGVTAHIVSHMFHRIWKDVRRDYKVSLSYLQIYNEQIHDLLNPHGQLECTIREDATHGPYVENITKVVCETPMDAYDLINIGRKSVVLGETKMNRLSNRSHTVCQISIDRYKKDPRQKKKSMQETYTYVSDILAAQETESGIDFTTIPFNKENLKKRHSIAVAKINRRKSTKSDSVQTSTPKSLLSVPGHAKKRNSLRDDLLPSYPRRLRSKQNSPGGSFSDEASLISKRASLPAKKASDEKPTMMDAIGVQNVERLQSIYRSSFDSDIDQSHDDRVESRGKYLYKSPSSMSSDFSYSDGSAIESESHYGTSECLETDGYVRENSASVFEEDKVAKASNEEENVVVKGKISIVDLAGSERFKTFADDERLKEAQNINLSLLELGNVISALTNEKQKHIPYRNSVLTRLLQESLGGNSKTTFLLCVSTKVNDMNEAKCTFEFGQKLKKVLTKPILNLDIDYRRKYHELLAKCERTEEEYQSMVDECKMLQKSAVEQEGDMNRTIEDQQLLMKSVQIEFDKVVTECMEANNKLDTFQEKLTATETMLDAKDEEISKLREDLIKALVNQHLSSETTVHSEDSELYNTANYNHVHIHDEITLNTDISDDNVALANIEDLKKSIYDADILQEDTDTVDAVYSISSFSNDTPHTTFTSPVSSVHINGNDDMDVPEKESCNFSDQPVASFDEESSIGETSIKNTEFESPKFLRVMRNHKKSLGTKKCDVACNTVAGNHIGNSSAPIIVTFLQSPRQTCEKVDDSNARSSTNFLVERHDVATNTLRDFESTKEPNKLSGDDLAMSKSSLLDIMFLDECYNQSQIYKLLRSENMDEIKSVLICELKELNMLSSRLEYLRHHRVGSSNENKEKMNTENSLLAINNSIDHEDLSSMSFKNFTEINPDMALLIKDIFDDSHPSEERFNMLDEELKKQFHQVCDDNAANKKTSVVCIEDRALILQSYLWKCKESMHTDLLKTANELSNFVGSSEIIDASSECNVYESIIQLLSKEDLLTQPSIYLLRNMMHLLLSAYSVTVCLLVLSSKKSLDHSDAGINYIGRVNETGSSYNNNIESINRNLSNISVCDTTKSSSVYTSMDSVGMTTRRREPIDNDIEFTKKKPKKNRLSKLLCMPTKSKNIKKGTNKCEDKIQTSV